MHFLRDAAGIVLDFFKVFRPDMLCRKDAGGIAGMYAGKFNMLHNGRHIGVGAVRDGIRLALKRMIQEAVDQDRSIRCHADSRVHIFCHGVIVIHDFHTASAKYVGWTDHDRIADFACDFLRFGDSRSHSGLRHRNAELVHHAAEKVAIFREVDDLR